MPHVLSWTNCWPARHGEGKVVRVSARDRSTATGQRVFSRSCSRLGRWLWALPRQSLMLLVRAYRLLLKPWLGNACRFEPTCSAYTLQALHQYGALGGTALGGWRILRCQPWCDGGIDPVPTAGHGQSGGTGLFTRLIPTRFQPDADSGVAAPHDTTRTPS